MAKSLSPVPDRRSDHESALIGKELHLFGGRNKRYFFPRNEVWTCNVQEEKKWIRRFAEGKNIPPPCVGARCVVINGVMYSYGGMKEDRNYLGELFGLDPQKMKWIHVATPSNGKKPFQRSSCCLWAIGKRMIMFGGWSGYIPPFPLQSGSQFTSGVNNEIYEFVFEEGRERGYWLDVELSGRRPQPRDSAAVETIDQHRGILHGGEDGMDQYFDDAFVIDLQEKKWICVNYFSKVSARSHHRICRLSKTAFNERNCLLVIGGYEKCKFSDHAYVIDIDKEKSYVFQLNSGIAPIWFHNLYCVENRDGSAWVIVSGGRDWDQKLKDILIVFTLGRSNESYFQVELQILSDSPSTLASTASGNDLHVRELQSELERMRMELSDVREETVRVPCGHFLFVNCNF